MRWGQSKEEKLSTIVGGLVDDTRALAKAEIVLTKAKIGARMAAYKNAVIFFAIAGVLAFGAMIAALVGMIVSLATVIGPGLATAAVVIGTLVLAAVLGMIGKGKLAKPAVPRSDMTS